MDEETEIMKARVKRDGVYIEKTHIKPVDHWLRTISRHAIAKCRTSKNLK